MLKLHSLYKTQCRCELMALSSFAILLLCLDELGFFSGDARAAMFKFNPVLLVMCCKHMQGQFSTCRQASLLNNTRLLFSSHLRRCTILSVFSKDHHMHVFMAGRHCISLQSAVARHLTPDCQTLDEYTNGPSSGR